MGEFKAMKYPHICLRCGFRWNGYKPNPVECPDCKNRKWRDAIIQDAAYIESKEAVNTP